MFNEIFLVPVSIYDRLMTGACQDDLVNPKKIKELAYRDQAVYFNLSTGATRSLAFTVSDPLSPKEIAEDFPQVRNNESLALARVTYNDTVACSAGLPKESRTTLEGAMKRMRIVTAGDRIAVVYEGDLQDMPRTLTARAIAASIINSLGFETYLKLAGGSLHKRVCVARH